MPEPTTPAGATPAAAGATPTQTTPVSPAADPTPPAAPPAPATGEPDALGDAGKRALEAERKRANDAEKALKTLQAEHEQLTSATKTDAEKAIAQAKKDGAAEVLERVHGQIRRSELKVALAGAGINPAVLDFVLKADEFEALKVTDTGSVEGLDAAVVAFKAAHQDLFAKPGTPGTADGGPRGGTAGLTLEKIKAMTPGEYAKNREAVMEFLAKPK